MDKTPDNLSNTPFWVANWYVDPAAGRLNREGAEIKLEPKVMTVLVCLAQKAGSVVSREELEDAASAGTIVGYNALASSIIKLRKAFGDDSRQPQVIETVSKKGYRLIAPVSVTDSASDAALPKTNHKTQSQSDIRRFRLLSVLGLTVLLVMLSGYVVYNTDEDKPSLAITASLGKIDASIAVLPFSNISGLPDQDYIASGLTEDIITDLSRLSRLLVISRSSVMGYKGAEISAHDVSQDLGVRYVLTGSIRKLGNQIRITAQLTDATNNVQVWADRFDRKFSEFVTVQDEITQKIVSALVIRLTNEEQVALTRRYTQNLKAHDFYMRGRALYNSITKEGNDLARVMFNRAIELDPNFSRAYAAMALTHVDDYRRKWGSKPSESTQQALAIALKAVEIDKDAAVAHWVLGYIYLYGELKTGLAIASAEQAILLNPGYADAYALVASAYSYDSRSDDAIRLNKHAMRLNPTTSFIYYTNLGRDYYFKNKLTAATENLIQATTVNNNYLNAHLYLAATYARMGNIGEASWQIDEIHNLDPEFSLKYWTKVQPYTSASRLSSLVEDLRKAGAPE